jgi:hypothetical protein
MGNEMQAFFSKMSECLPLIIGVILCSLSFCIDDQVWQNLFAAFSIVASLFFVKKCMIKQDVSR